MLRNNVTMLWKVCNDITQRLCLIHVSNRKSYRNGQYEIVITNITYGKLTSSGLNSCVPICLSLQTLETRLKYYIGRLTVTVRDEYTVYIMLYIGEKKFNSPKLDISKFIFLLNLMLFGSQRRLEWCIEVGVLLKRSWSFFDFSCWNGKSKGHFPDFMVG